jgi:hypothetical protein
VACLGYTGQLVEITATAVVPEQADTRVFGEIRP